MQDFRVFLQQEFVKRNKRNPSYSLRAFAQQLRISHATLSTLLSGKRKITQATIQKLAPALDLSPSELAKFMEPASETQDRFDNHFLIQQDAFSAMSEWYFDAVLELSLIPNFNLKPEVIALSIGISSLQAKIALDTLERLGLLIKLKNGRYRIQHRNTVNLLDPDFTSAANRKYQRSVLEKSIEALEQIDRKDRDHTSTTMAINRADVAKAKELIRKFRHDLNAYLQRADSASNEVYQLQISFFPLSQNSKLQTRS